MNASEHDTTTAANGDRVEAFVAAFRDTRGLIDSIAKRHCGENSAADVTQEVFLRVWNNIDRIDESRGSLRAYLVTVARGVSIDFARRDSARRRREDLCGRDTTRADGDPNQHVIRAEEVSRLTGALGGLAPDERRAIMTAFYDDMSYREVATRLGIPEGTAKSRIRHGLTTLRSALHDLDQQRDAS